MPSWAEYEGTARSHKEASLKMRNSTHGAELIDTGEEGQYVIQPNFYRFVLLSHRTLSSVLSIQFEMTLSLSFLLSNNHNLLFLSLLNSSSSWFIISESWNLHMENYIYYEKAALNKKLIRNV